MSKTISPYDPIDKAKFRLATKEESQQAQGGILWKWVKSPWDVVCRVMGTLELVFKKSDPHAWQRPLIQSWVERVFYHIGYNQEELFLNSIYTFFLNDRHMICDSSTVYKAFLRHHRNDSIFASSISMKAFFKIFKEIFPDDHLEENLQVTEDDFIMTCTSNRTKEFHTLLRPLLKGNGLKTFAPRIYPKVEETLQNWFQKSESEEVINATVETRIFATRVITDLMFGKEFFSEEIAESIDFINKFIMDRILKKVTHESETEYERVKKIFKDSIDEILSNENLPLFENSKNLSDQKKKALIFVILFAGQETTSSLLTWILRQLALHPKKQNKLYKAIQETAENCPADELVSKLEAIKNLFNRSIAEFTPVYGIGRLFKEDVCLEYHVKGEQESRKRIFFKDEIISIRISEQADRVLEKSEKDPFNYEEWFPFGGGPHKCPGEKLAYQEITQFILGLVKNYIVETEQRSYIKKRGHVTLKLEEDVLISLKSRC